MISQGRARCYSSLEFRFALRANDLSQLVHYRHLLNLLSRLEGLDSCRASRPSLTISAAALLSEVTEIVALPDLRFEVPEDRVRDRDVEEEVG
jgi:hypothetical protein